MKRPSTAKQSQSPRNYKLSEENLQHKQFQLSKTLSKLQMEQKSLHQQMYSIEVNVYIYISKRSNAKEWLKTRSKAIRVGWALSSKFKSTNSTHKLRRNKATSNSYKRIPTIRGLRSRTS